MFEPLVRLILEQEGSVVSAQQQQQRIKQRIRIEHRDRLLALVNGLIGELPEDDKKCALAAQEKGASSWLTALPLEQHGLSLTRTEFHDAITLRYG